MGQLISSRVAPKVSRYRDMNLFFFDILSSLKPAQMTYKTTFSLAGVPGIKEFIQRPEEMRALEDALLPKPDSRQKVFVLHGLGGIGKTQLSAEFARRFEHRFSSVFWLDGSSIVNLKRSIAACAKRIPVGHISDTSRTGGDVNTAAADVKDWLSQTNNTNWFVIVDNLDEENEPNSFRNLITEYISEANHGSILFTTRLTSLHQLGTPRRLKKLDKRQAQQMLKSWTQYEYGASTYQ